MRYIPEDDPDNNQNNEPTVDPTKHAKRGIAIVTSSVAAPIVTTVAVKAAGFGALGIAKGSIASMLMSKAAIAAGGGIAKGSMVAILQSVGAAGLGSAILPIAVIGGAFMAAITYGPDLVAKTKELIHDISSAEQSNDTMTNNSAV